MLDLLNDGVMSDLRRRQKAQLEKVLDAIGEDLREVMGLPPEKPPTSGTETGGDHGSGLFGKVWMWGIDHA